MKRILPLSCSLLLTVSAVLAQDSAAPLYKDSRQPVEVRVADLVQRMTLAEKLAQLGSMGDPSGKILDQDGDQRGQLRKEQADEILKHGIGQFQLVVRRSGFGPAKSAALTNTIQKYFVENTRLGIPVFFSEECLHGLCAEDTTVFPQCIGMSATWDPALVQKMYAVVALESRVRGVSQALTPMMDVVHDPRWGRIEESWGEDPYLTSRFAVAAVRGLQGNGPAIDSDHIAATAKHFAGYGRPEGGNNRSSLLVGERDLREYFLPPFKAAVTEAGVLGLMPAYHEIDGVPCHANPFLLETVLRGEWGFQGVVLSDYGGVGDLAGSHRIAADKSEAARLALESGVDVELPGIDCFASLAEQVSTGKLPIATIDRAVKNMLRAKFLTGLFDRPYADPARAEQVNHTTAHRALAREIAQKAIVLLKNDGALLPLDAAKIKTLAVIGPNADRVLLGGYTHRQDLGVTVRQGLAQKLGDKTKITYAEGCRIHTKDGFWKTTGIALADPAANRMAIQQAVEVAQAADAVVLVVGDDPAMCSENHDVAELDLAGLQNELVTRIAELGKPTVVVLINGRPLAISTVAKTVPAIVEAWYPGEEGGHAVADVLFGDVNPSGKLTYTFPRSTGQLPVYYNRKTSRRSYVLSDATPLFPFGFGLSYSQFKYSNLQVRPAKITKDTPATVTVDITNTSPRAGDEIAQMYIRDRVSSVVRPRMELKGFERISLKAGETKTVSFTITPEKLALYNARMQFVVEPGMFDVMVGGSSVDTTSIPLEVTP